MTINKVVLDHEEERAMYLKELFRINKTLIKHLEKQMTEINEQSHVANVNAIMLRRNMKKIFNSEFETLTYLLQVKETNSDLFKKLKLDKRIKFSKDFINKFKEDIKNVDA